MNERIKELAEQAGLLGPTSRVGNAHEAAERFAELIRQDEREQISHTYLKLTLEAVLREREACAKLVEDEAFDEYLSGRDCANAIRQRGEK